MGEDEYVQGLDVVKPGQNKILESPNDDQVDWLQSLKQFFINVSYHILVASLTLMALFYQS